MSIYIYAYIYTDICTMKFTPPYPYAYIVYVHIHTCIPTEALLGKDYFHCFEQFEARDVVDSQALLIVSWACIGFLTSWTLFWANVGLVTLAHIGFNMADFIILYKYRYTDR